MSFGADFVVFLALRCYADDANRPLASATCIVALDLVESSKRFLESTLVFTSIVALMRQHRQVPSIVLHGICQALAETFGF